MSWIQLELIRNNQEQKRKHEQRRIIPLTGYHQSFAANALALYFFFAFPFLIFFL